MTTQANPRAAADSSFDRWFIAILAAGAVALVLIRYPFLLLAPVFYPTFFIVPALWIVASVIVGRIAALRGQSKRAFFWCAFGLSPIFAILVLLAMIVAPASEQPR